MTYSQSADPLLLGVDTGGTFTDFVLMQGQEIRIHKVLSTPLAPEEAILKGISDLGIMAVDLPRLTLIHGSTVATNAALEHKGVRTAYVTNSGMADLLTIGRQARRELYNLQPQPEPPPVPPELCLEVEVRMGADGRQITSLSDEAITTLVNQIGELRPQAIAINLLFSFLDPTDEIRIEAALPQELFITRSSEILPEQREYERGITTWLNAWVGPLVEGYLARLTSALPRAHISIMQSTGTTMAASRAGREAVKMLLSGPAGGLAGAKGVAALSGVQQLLTFDMGGTSTDVAMIHGELQLTSEGKIGNWPVSVPMVDMHTIGAGGGSIATIDAGGMLHVGPESAGAAPGPACYGQGGTLPTVTDANLLLGHIPLDGFLGGKMQLDLYAAQSAYEPLAHRLGCSIREAAQGVIDLANEQMARALRVISIERGEDPRQATLVSFGGAGGLHVCALADALGMDQTLVPVHSGVLSALGMLMAPRGRNLSHAVHQMLDQLSTSAIEQRLQPLVSEGSAALIEEGISQENIDFQTRLELRYQGQTHTLSIPWQSTMSLPEHEEVFHLSHQHRYGHRMDRPVELVSLRLRLTGPDPKVPLTQRGHPCEASPQLIGFDGHNQQVECWQRDQLGDQEVKGPALVVDAVSTTWVESGWHCRLEPNGSLALWRFQPKEQP